jgi:hypothetical protein
VATGRLFRFYSWIRFTSGKINFLKSVLTYLSRLSRRLSRFKSSYIFVIFLEFWKAKELGMAFGMLSYQNAKLMS